MAIKRRILREHYKINSKRFNALNKIKINTMRNRSTYLNKIFKARKLSKIYEKQYYINYLSFWQNLNNAEQKKEIEFAKNDIKVFSKYVQNVPSFENEKFQAYLPKAQWKNMTQQQRKLHLQKRDAIRKKNTRLKKKYLSIKRPKVYFTNIKNRPWLKNISQHNKIAYLKILLNRAKVFVEEKAGRIKIHPAFKIHPATQTAPAVLQHLLNFKDFFKTNFKIKKNAYIFRLLPKKHVKKYA